MADILAVCGRRDWVEAHPLADEETRVRTFYSSSQKNWACRLGFRSGPSPWPGGAQKEAHTWVGWLGDLRAVDGEARRSVIASPEECLYTKWRDKGKAGLADLHGRVAGCVLELEPLRLHVFRDKIGTIPLAFASDDEGMIVASNSAWLLDLRKQPRRPNRARLRRFLTWAEDCGRDDFYQGLERLRPGEALSWRPGNDLDIYSYWSPNTDPIEDVETLDAQFSNTLEQVFDDVSRHNPVVAMSGGFDSAFVAAALAARSSGQLDVVSKIAPGMPIVDESDAIDQLESALPVRVYRYDITDHLPVFDDPFWDRDYGTGPIHHGGEWSDVAMRRWMVDELDCQTLVLGTGPEVLVEATPRWRAIRDVLSSGSLRGWQRLWKTRSPFVFLKQCVRAILEHADVFDEIAPLYRAVRDRWKGQTHRSSPWSDPANWMIDPPPNNEVTSEPRSIGACKLRALQGWRLECIFRGGERQARRSNTTSLQPYFDDRLWSLGLRLPPSETIEAWILRRCARSYLPEWLASRSNRQSFAPFIARGIVHQTDWINKHFQASELDGAGIVRDENVREIYDRYLYHVQNKESLGIRIVSQSLLWNTLSAESWLEYLKSSDIG